MLNAVKFLIPHFFAFFLLLSFALANDIRTDSKKSDENAKKPSSKLLSKLPLNQLDVLGSKGIKNIISGLEMGSGLDFLIDLIKTLNFEKFAVEGYFINCYIDTLILWIKLQLERAFVPTETLSLFDFYDIRVPVFGESIKEVKNAKFPDFNSEKSLSSGAYKKASAVGEKWLASLLSSTKTAKISNIIEALSTDGLLASSNRFQIPSSDQLQRKEASMFFEEVMGKIRVWLAFSTENDFSSTNNIQKLASIIVKEIETKTSGGLSDFAKWSAMNPLGASKSPLASPLMLLGSLLTQVIVQTLLFAIGKNELLGIVLRVENWLEQPIMKKLQFGNIDMDFRQIIMSFIDTSLKRHPEAAKLRSEKDQLTWGLVVGIFTMLFYRARSRSLDPLSSSEITSIVAHLISLIEKKTFVLGENFWGFFEGLSNPKLMQKITQWFGSAQAVCRIAVYALNHYQGAELSPLNRKVHLAVPFEVLDVMLSFPICLLDCSNIENHLKKASVQISLVEWMIRFVGTCVYLDSLVGSRDLLTHDLAARDRSGMSWALLVDIPILFCNVYQWSLLSNCKDSNAPIDQELLTRIVSSFPIDGIALKTSTTSLPIKKLWKELTTSKSELLGERILVSAGMISKYLAVNTKEDSEEKWILSQLIELFGALDDDKKWNCGIGCCEQPPPPPPAPPVKEKPKEEKKPAVKEEKKKNVPQKPEEPEESDESEDQVPEKEAPKIDPPSEDQSGTVSSSPPAPIVPAPIAPAPVAPAPVAPVPAPPMVDCYGNKVEPQPPLTGLSAWE